ncbi:patched domain-containing protein 3-like [Centruroides vittatus]|uniref:patched domain-containing protein 3-like n=1 Tax=Centruroides vittatus TaxID=120091 RepID=UPI00350F2A93
MACNPLYKVLSNRFRQLGCRIAKYPKWFIVLPIFSSLFLATGLQKKYDLNDIETLTTPKTSKAPYYRERIESLFRMNLSSNFDAGRITTTGRFGTVIISSKNGDNVLRQYVFNDVLKLNHFIQNISILLDGDVLKYKDLCARNEEQCFRNSILDLNATIGRLEKRKYFLKYPLMWISKTEILFLPPYLGGVTLDENGYVTSARALRLTYFLDNSNKRKETAALLWESAFLNVLNSLELENINFEIFVSTSLEREVSRAPVVTLPYIIIAGILVISFTVTTCLMPNCIQGKPWIAIGTALSSAMATVSGFGLMAYCGFPHVFFNVTVPFLILGIGMDDTFVLLSAWRRSDRKQNVEKRLGETYSVSAVSITLTSLTNIVCFFIGAVATTFLGCNIYCGYICCCLVFDYIYQITFIGGLFAICGYAEEKNLHAITFMPIKDKHLNKAKGCFQKTLKMTGHYSEGSQPKFLISIWNSTTNALRHFSVKLAVILLLIVYLTLGTFGAMKLKNELKFIDLTFYQSNLWRSVSALQDNFNQYQERIQLVVTQPLDYANQKVQEELEIMTRTFESHPVIADSSLTQSWLRTYLTYLKSREVKSLTSEYNFNRTEDFIIILRKFFLNFPPTDTFKKDIIFNEDYSQIVASRIWLQTNSTETESEFYKFFQFRPDFSSLGLIVYNPLLYSADSTEMTIYSTFQIFGITAIASVIITFALLPSAVISLCVSCCILSVAVGVIGFMTWWGVSINIISMITLIAVSGFSVDYIAHVAYAYVSAEASHPVDKMLNAVKHVGLPILQGSFSTVLCVIPFVIPPANFTLVIMKIIVLLCVFSTLHAMLFLPVMLCLVQTFLLSLKKVLVRRTDSIQLNSVKNQSRISYIYNY